MMPLLQQHTGFKELLDSKDDLQQAPGEIVSADKIHTFQEAVGTPFVALLKKNISIRFATHDIVSELAIFDPCNIPSTYSSQFSTYGKKSIEVLLNHYGKDKFALTLNDKETVMTAVISPEVHTEWITFHAFLAKKPEDIIALQLELITKLMKCWLQCYQTSKDSLKWFDTASFNSFS